MKRAMFIVPAFGALFLAACLVAPAEPVPSSGAECIDGQKAFNGACRETCATSADCVAGTSCMAVGGDSALCLDYDHCGYLGDDTECTGTGPYLSSYSEDGYEHGYGDADECRGNARWISIEPSTDPRCGVRHPVRRCRRVGTECRIEVGTTLDVADP